MVDDALPFKTVISIYASHILSSAAQGARMSHTPFTAARADGCFSLFPPKDPLKDTPVYSACWWSLFFPNYAVSEFGDKISVGV